MGLGLGAASLVSNIRSSNINDLNEYLKLGQSVEKEETEKQEAERELWEDIAGIEQNGEFEKAALRKVKIETDKESLKKIKWSAEQEELSRKEQMEEFMFLGLRMMEGVGTEEFEKQFGKSLQEVYGEQIGKLEKQGLLKFCKETGRYALTLPGIDVSNQVFVEFIE